MLMRNGKKRGSNLGSFHASCERHGKYPPKRGTCMNKLSSSCPQLDCMMLNDRSSLDP